MTKEGASVAAQPDRIEQVETVESVAAGSHTSARNGALPVDVPAARERARAIPEATVARLAVYLRVLSGLANEHSATDTAPTISSEELAGAAGVNSAKLRKDLSYLGSYGTRGVGYDVEVLIGQIERTLGLTRKYAVAVAGIGNLGHALAGYSGFASRGFPVTALFDVDPDLIGIRIAGIEVHHIERIPDVCAAHEISIGVIATPGEGAQEVCDLLVKAGVRCILNFAPVVLQTPAHVEVRKVDLAVELQILSFQLARRELGEEATVPYENTVPEQKTAPEESTGLVVPQ
jgi:redox-sensing transcriptional repressor